MIGHTGDICADQRIAMEEIPLCLSATPVLDPIPGKSEAPVFAIIDAAKIFGLPEMLETSGLPHRCLLRDAAAFGHVAPWLVAVDGQPQLLRRLLTSGDGPSALWNKQAAIFLRSESGMDGLGRHLSRLVKVASYDGPAMFLRFWDPAIAHHYFAGIAGQMERALPFFSSPHARIQTLIVPSEAAGSARVFTLSDRGRAAAGVVVLDRFDRELLAQAHEPRLEHELADWLKRADPQRFRPFTPAQRKAVASHAVRESRTFGLRFKEEISYFLYMMSFLGGWFHKSPLRQDFAAAMMVDDDRRYARMRQGFPVAYDAFFADEGDPVHRLIALRDSIAAMLQGREWSAVSADEVLGLAAFVERPFLNDRAKLEAERQLVLAEAARLGLSGRRDVAAFYTL